MKNESRKPLFSYIRLTDSTNSARLTNQQRFSWRMKQFLGSNENELDNQAKISRMNSQRRAIVYNLIEDAFNRMTADRKIKCIRLQLHKSYKKYLLDIWDTTMYKETMDIKVMDLGVTDDCYIYVRLSLKK